MKPEKVGIRGRRSEDEDEQPEEERGQRDARARGHHQPQAVVGVVVVDAVDDEVEAGADRVVGLPVEDEAVQPVLRQRPDEEPERDQERRARPAP